MASVAIVLTLASCGHAQGSSNGTTGSKASAIELGDGTGYTFDPRDVPPGTRSAQAAYNAMRGARPPQAVPASVIPRYGLLSQNDTSPTAYLMPVWCFTRQGRCTVTMNVADPGNCVYWDFARASDGKDLMVEDQQQLP